MQKHHIRQSIKLLISFLLAGILITLSMIALAGGSVSTGGNTSGTSGSTSTTSTTSGTSSGTTSSTTGSSTGSTNTTTPETDSTKVAFPPENVPPQPSNIMQSLTGVTPGTTVGIYGMVDAQNYVTNPANNCAVVPTPTICYTTMNVSTLGSPNPTGGTGCPTNYQTLYNFGTGVFLGNTSTQVYYYGYDARVMSSNAMYS